ncbi:MAG: ABC transporter ATP-binding protein [Gammaproteobacteria bacterium]|nr:ABC transporter ATP-binding protein [Gammaproteobacteria bacterium]
MKVAEPLLEVKNIETYYGLIAGIRGVSLEVRGGSIVTILGANGAGKTTVLKTISGAMTPEKGSVCYAGKDITGRDPDRITRLGIAHVPEGREVFPFLSTEENLKMGAFTRKNSTVNLELDRIFEYFPLLREQRKLPAGFLSGGQQQMLAIGRALMLRPQLMLLDEPSLGLSPKLVHATAEIIKSINQDQGVTVLLVEQNAQMALEIAHFGYILENGRVVLEDSTSRLSKATDVQEFYLGKKASSVRGKRRWKQRKTWR